MISKLLEGAFKIFGSRNEREIKRLWPVVHAINAREPEFEKLTDAELRAVTDRLKARHQAGETLDALLVDAFAAVRECSKRTPPPGGVSGLRHFDVQLIGGIVLHKGKIAEMSTGEGKTLVATCPAYLNAISGQGVHVITVNDYLARRDREWMGVIYEKLGMSVGVIQSELSNAERAVAYGADITYGTNNEFGFDYLRDNMKSRLTEQVQRRNFAILDEVDNILIDEARTPLIISGPSEGDTAKYARADVTTRKLIKGTHFEIKEKESQAILTEAGIIYAQELLGVESFYAGRHMEWPHLLEQSLRAHHLFSLDVDYVVQAGEDGQREVVIVDEFTGRLMSGRRWSDGLHQAVEAKERITVRAESQTLATITFQNFFKLYKKLAGMTGTAMTEAGEFLSIYKLDVASIPTNRPMIRDDQNDYIYADEKDKFTAIVSDIMDRHQEGRPILVGTTSIEKSEKLSGVLQRRGIKHEVLNAKQHAREADIIAQAGRAGAVTIATNMAGRGTDILLGGNAANLAKAACGGVTEGPDFEERLSHFRAQCSAERERVLTAGGLHIIGTERHDARRIDNQLRGRAGRQGDPGSSRFYLCLEDDLMRRFAGPRIISMLQKLGLKDGQHIEHKMVSRSVERAQKKVEERNFDIRKRLLEYDEVMNEQRTLIYDYRQRILRGDDLRDLVLTMVGSTSERAVDDFCPPKTAASEWDVTGLSEWYTRKTGLAAPEFSPGGDLTAVLRETFARLYDERAQGFGKELEDLVARYILLNSFDTRWKEHLYNMDALKGGIGLRSYGNEDPKIAYKREGYQLFEEMLRNIEDEVADLIFRVEVGEKESKKEELQPAKDVWSGGVASHQSWNDSGRGDMENAAYQSQSKEPAKPFKREGPKLGRNDPCHCGSGLKFKKCHGEGQ
ncbi:MAG TPA: preprotein translocase subunit SecA [Planctomycetota bacterium]|jgi:preprotein translocase subunit SecA|nr:preprotein translocase subunit SecA [Planctomycetota bacterium]